MLPAQNLLHIQQCDKFHKPLVPADPVAAFATNKITDLHLFFDGTQCLPLYRYTDDGERVCNITDWAIRHINDYYT